MGGIAALIVQYPTLLASTDAESRYPDTNPPMDMNRTFVATGAGLGVALAIVLVITLGGGDTDAPPPSAGAQTASPTTTSFEITVTEFDRNKLPADLHTVSQDWTTDFSRTTIEYEELLIGISALPIRDRIPPIDDPDFDPVSEATHVAGRAVNHGPVPRSVGSSVSATWSPHRRLCTASISSPNPMPVAADGSVSVIEPACGPCSHLHWSGEFNRAALRPFIENPPDAHPV